jgi:hypothetical protein
MQGRPAKDDVSTYVGLDFHRDTIAGALADGGGSGDVRAFGLHSDLSSNLNAEIGLTAICSYSKHTSTVRLLGAAARRYMARCSAHRIV